MRSRPTLVWLLSGVSSLMLASCGGSADAGPLTFSASALGVEAEVVRGQLARFGALHPDVPVELRVTPDAADQRHQLYVQWLNARATDPDVLQLDIIWTAEFAAAGWILPLDRLQTHEELTAIAADFFPATIRANTWRDRLYALPWFVDIGLLYWRTDLVNAPPDSLAELQRAAIAGMRQPSTPFGLVWQGARYEGLITVFLEHLGAFGGGILDEDGAVIVDRPEAVRALTFMCDAVGALGLVPPSALTWQEEQTRFAFQNGQAVFMRNWPYAWTLLNDAGQSRVAGRVGLAAFPAAAGGRATAALGGAQLAVNAHSDRAELAWELIEFLAAPAQMLERAAMAGQLPARPSLFETDALAAALPLPLGVVRSALDAARPRPVTPVYSELSEVLQVRVHRALTGQQTPAAALHDAAREIRELLARTGLLSTGPRS